MLFNYQYLAFALLLPLLTKGLPLEATSKVRDIAPRAKSYAIVNVDGGSTAAPDATTVVEKTKVETETVQVTHVASTMTGTINSATADPTLAPTPPSSSPSPSSSKSSISPSASYISTPSSVVSTPESTPQPSSSSSVKPTPTVDPSVVTVIITETAGPTEYYDNGLWHTSYAVKTFENIVLTTLTSIASSSLPTLEPSSTSSYNQTQY